MSPSKILIFSDLDGTLLDHHYSYAAARPALARLKQLNIPLILNTSKTAAELLPLVKELDLPHPFVVENGGAIVMPDGYFALTSSNGLSPLKGAKGYEQLTLGRPIAEILAILGRLRRQGFHFRGFADMSTDTLMEETGLTKEAARAAKQRTSSEPLIWLDSEENRIRFEKQLQDNGLTLVKGGQFWHVMGPTDKARAMSWLTDQYQTIYRERPATLALGDSPNDREMLLAADAAVVLPGKNPQALRDLHHPNIQFTSAPAPAGWNSAVNQFLDHYQH